MQIEFVVVLEIPVSSNNGKMHHYYCKPQENQPI